MDLREATGRLLGAVREALPSRLRGLVDRLLDRDILLTGSSLAFYGLVSMLPLLLIAFAVTKAVAGGGTLTTFAQETVQSGSIALGSFIANLAENSSSLSWVTVLAALWPATAYGSGLRRALTHTSDGGDDDEMPGLRGRALGIALVFALPVLVLTGIPLAFVLIRVTGSGPLGIALGWSAALVAAVTLGTLTTAAIYHAFAPEGFGWRETVLAAVPVAALTTVFTLGFVVYLRLGQVEERFGGGATAAVVLMGVWLFVANVLLLAGYHVAIELHENG